MLHVAVAAVVAAVAAFAAAAVNSYGASSYGLTFIHFKGYINLGAIGLRQLTRIKSKSYFPIIK